MMNSRNDRKKRRLLHHIKRNPNNNLATKHLHEAVKLDLSRRNMMTIVVVEITIQRGMTTVETILLKMTIVEIIHLETIIEEIIHLEILKVEMIMIIEEILKDHSQINNQNTNRNTYLKAKHPLSQPEVGMTDNQTVMTDPLSPIVKIGNMMTMDEAQEAAIEVPSHVVMTPEEAEAARVEAEATVITTNVPMKKLIASTLPATHWRVRILRITMRRRNNLRVLGTQMMKERKKELVLEGGREEEDQEEEEVEEIPVQDSITRNQLI